MEQSNFKIWEFLKPLLITLGIVFLVKQFIFSPIVVDGPSMEPTLEDRDYMIVNKLKYKLGEIDRFDMIVFHATEKKDYIKRVIGLPGEHVAFQDNVLYIDGQAVEEPFLDNSKGMNIVTGDFTLEQVTNDAYEEIPEGYVFVLGDNRSNSTDSRMIGLVSVEDIVGKTSIIYWPIKRINFSKK